MLRRAFALFVSLCCPLLAAQEPGTLSLSPDRSVLQYQETINGIETQGGAFDPQLREELIGLGLAQLAAEDAEEALAAFERALHVTRVNYGLYDLRQAPIIELIIDGHSRLQEWEAVNDNYQHLMWLHRRAYGVDGQEMIPAYMSYAEWNLRASELPESGRSTIGHLLEAERAYALAVEAMDANDQFTTGERAEVLYAETYANYRVAEYLSQDPAGFTSQMTAGVAPFVQPRANEDFIALERELNSSYKRGRDALERIAADAEQTGDHALQVAALTYLGDWYLQFGKRSAAAEAYADAATVRDQHPQVAELLDSLYSKPSLLPAVPFEIGDRDAASIRNQDDVDDLFVILAFDIGETGRAINIQVAESSPEASARDIRTARGWLQQTRFRPQIIDGTPQVYEGASVRYVIEDGSR